MKKFKRSRNSQVSFEPNKEKKRISGPAIFAIVVIVLMTASAIGYIWGGEESTYYGDYKFERSGSKWVTKLDKETVSFYLLPSEVESIRMDDSVLGMLSSTKMVYLTSDPRDKFNQTIGLASFELINEFQKKKIYPVLAFTEENEFGKDIITCGNATMAVPVIYFTTPANLTEAGIRQESANPYCILIEADSDFNFMALKDRLLYGFLGIIK